MKRLRRLAYCVMFLAAGCTFPLGESFNSRDSVDNVSDIAWLASVTLDPRPTEKYWDSNYVIAPATHLGFQASARTRPLPVLTSFIAFSEPSAARFTLTADDIGKLRQAARGEVHLVLFADGFACQSPEIQAYLAISEKSGDFTRKDRFAFLRLRKTEMLEWTHDVLNRANKVSVN